MSKLVYALLGLGCILLAAFSPPLGIAGFLLLGGAGLILLLKR